MATRVHINTWVEEPTHELGDGRRVSQANVDLGDGANYSTKGTFQSLLVYRADGTSEFVSLLRLTMSLEGRHGSFVALGGGSYDGATAEVTASIVAGSGTDDLTGITGTVTSRSGKTDYPYMPLTIDSEFRS
jgi:hypothetical protein